MNVGKVAEYSNPLPSTTPKSTTETNAKKDSTLTADNPNTDRFVEDNRYSYTPAYTKASAKTESEQTDTNASGISISKATSKTALKNESFKSMVADIIGKQSGLAYNTIIKDAAKIQNGTLDDYWSADQTAQRIYDFARALAGDDDSKLEELRSAVKEGFRQAGAKFDSSGNMSGLPSVCSDTYTKVMSLFDDWANESASSSEKEA